MVTKWMMYVVVVIVSLILSTANVKMQGSRINKAEQDNRSQKVVGTGTGENKVNQRRIALVIGNGKYAIKGLSNPVNDAVAMEKALTSVGFQVTRSTDLTQIKMKEAIVAFGESLKSGGVGLFYYAGHGMQVKGENYLIPIDSQISKESDVDVYGVNVSNILEQMSEAKNSLNILILDACRDNPFIASSGRSGTRGLAQINASKGLFIAYATSPGETASDGSGTNSPYTEELVKALNVPGLSIEEVFKQVLRGVDEKTRGDQLPWISSVLSGDFYFRPGTSSDNAALEREKAVWQGCCVNSNRISDYQSYLQQYPTGIYSTTAKGRIGELEKSANRVSENPKIHQKGYRCKIVEENGKEHDYLVQFSVVGNTLQGKLYQVIENKIQTVTIISGNISKTKVEFDEEQIETKTAGYILKHIEVDILSNSKIAQGYWRGLGVYADRAGSVTIWLEP